jgi:hypothetical protein
MTITLDLDREEAVKLRIRLMNDAVILGAVRDNLVDALSNAIQNENERLSERQHELAMQDGGRDSDPNYRRSMTDGGRGNLLR